MILTVLMMTSHLIMVCLPQNNVGDCNDLEENIILQTAIHVKHAHTQRQLANNKVKSATFTNDKANKVPHQDKVQTIIMDYCQNLNLPHLCEDQPRDAYYFSPLSIFCLWICDAVSNHISAYIYDESKGGKGENNVDRLKTNYLGIWIYNYGVYEGGYQSIPSL